MKIKNLITQLEKPLETAKAILAEQTATGIKRYVHKDGFGDDSISHVEVEGEKVSLVYKSGEKRPISYWPVERTEYFEKKGIWVCITESAAKAPVKVRRFKHRQGKNAFYSANGKHRATFVEEKDGKLYTVLKNGHRELSTWTPEEAKMFIEKGWWIEVK